MNYNEFKKILESFYVEQLKSNPVRIFHDFKDMRKYFRENFGLSRKFVDAYFNQMHDDWQNTGMRFYGGISSEFTKDKWMETTNGNKYVVWGFSGKIRPDLLKYSTVIMG